MTSTVKNSKELYAAPGVRQVAINQVLPFVIAMLAGVACYAIFLRRGLGLSVIGYSISPAERVMRGEVPYRDFLFNYTPGTVWLNAILMKAFGPTLMTIRAGLFFFKMLTLSMIFLVAKRLTCAWAALVPVALALAWLGHLQVFNVYPDQYLILFALLAISFVLNHNDCARGRWLFLGGVATGAVFVFKQNVGLFLLAAGISSIVVREALSVDDSSRRLRATARKSGMLFLGFACVAGALAAYLAYSSALGAMINHFVHHAVEYSETRAIGLPRPGQFKTAALAIAIAVAIGALVFYKATRLFPAYLIGALVFGSVVLLIPGRAYAFKESVLASIAYVPIAIFTASFAVALAQLMKARETSEYRAKWWQLNGPSVITGLFALGLYLEVFPRADTQHLVRVLPVVLLFLFALLARSFNSISEFFGARMPAPRRLSLLLVSLPLWFLLLAGLLDSWWPQFDAKLHLRDRTPLSIDRGRGILVEKRQAELAEGLVGLIEKNSEIDDPIFSFSQRGSSLYFLANRRNPSRLVWWSSVGISAEDREAVMNMIEARVPKLIILQDIPANKRIRDFVGSYYNNVGTITDIAVYSRIQ